MFVNALQVENPCHKKQFDNSFQKQQRQIKTEAFLCNLKKIAFFCLSRKRKRWKSKQIRVC